MGIVLLTASLLLSKIPPVVVVGEVVGLIVNEATVEFEKFGEVV